MELDPKNAASDLDKSAFESAIRRLYKRPKDKCDDHGQPRAEFRKPDVTRRQIDELIGTLRGIMADGQIVSKEVEFLNNWILNNEYAASEWPANVLHERILRAVADDRLDEVELTEIGDLIAAILGNKSGSLDQGVNSTTLPLSSPAPLIVHKDRHFCFTGKLFWGKRSDAEDLVCKLGGSICGVSEKLNFLVIGELNSRDWLHSTHGLKIKRALDMQAKCMPLYIVSEQHWVSSVPIIDNSSE